MRSTIRPTEASGTSTGCGSAVRRPSAWRRTRQQWSAVGSPIGGLREGQPLGTPFLGPGETEREWCLGLDGGATWHTFDGWRIWDSPTAAVDAKPEEWILLEGHLTAVLGELRLCAAAGCADSARVLDVAMPSHPELELVPVPGERFIAHVRDGALADLTRAVPLPAP